MSNRKRGPARIGIAERTDSKGRTQYRGTAYDKRVGRHLRGPWTPHLAEARAWRVDALARLQAGTLSAARGPTVREAVGRFLDGVESGAIRRSDGQPYKPSTVRGYRSDLRKRVVPAFGSMRLVRLTRTDCQRWVDGLMAEGYAAPTVRNIVAALRALIAWALPRGYTHNDPCSRLRLPSGGKKRDRVATPAEAASLVVALPPRDQAAFGLAVYAGLRIGEVVALDVTAIDFNRQVLEIVRGWDATARQFIETKSRKRRTVPISNRLAVLLADHLVLLDHPAEGLLFPSPRDLRYPIHPRQLRRHAAKAWKATGLEPMGFHEARHTFASTAIAAGMNAKTLCTLMGHASITVTYDTYGHLLSGNESEARNLLDTYLDDNGG